jgi:hypothetical protein
MKVVQPTGPAAGNWACRYTGRPPVATERLSLLPDGRLLYRLKRNGRDGTSHVIFDPLDFIGKLAALVPPPRFNLVRYQLHESNDQNNRSLFLSLGGVHLRL